MKIPYIEDQSFRQFNVKQLPGYQDNKSDHNVNKVLLMMAEKKKIYSKQKRKKNPLELKQLIKKTKVSILQQNFVRKLKRTIVYNTIPSHILQKQQLTNNSQQTLTQKFNRFLQKTNGISLKGTYQTLWSFVNIIQTAILGVILSFALAFPQTSGFQFFVYIRVASCVLYLFDMILNFSVQGQQLGKTKKSLKQIGKNYFSNQFLVDVISLLLFPLSLLWQQNNLNVILIAIVLIKLNNNLKKFQRFQYLYITKSQRQQYYGLLKVFILNFAIGHILSILLNLMATINPEQNWYDKIGIENSEWTHKYIWGYYWGTNIMLTVGFGDVSANNHHEAILLIFIETLSCITLAYNINYVGSIISQMKADNEQKKKKLKYFHKMCQQNQIHEQLENKICNFIEESYQIKQAFEFDQYEEVLQSLPKNIHSEYIKECNKHLFEVPFFNTLNRRTILSLAQAVNRRITHPDELIKRKGEICDFTILQKGTIGLVCRRNKSILNGQVIETLAILEKQKPKILSLDFIRRRSLQYDIKSLFYSVIYFLDYEKFMQSLKLCEMDFGLFCVMRDKDNFLQGEHELYKCEVCVNQFHNRFKCPKYHYCPLNQHVIATYHKKIKSLKQPRNAIKKEKRQYRESRCLLYHQNYITAHKKYLQVYCQEEEIQEINNIRKYYFQKKQERSVDFQQTLLASVKENNFQRQMNKIQQILVKNGSVFDTFWAVECDSAYNFKYYFNPYNPGNLNGTRINGSKKNYKERDLVQFASSSRITF